MKQINDMVMRENKRSSRSSRFRSACDFPVSDDFTSSGKTYLSIEHEQGIVARKESDQQVTRASLLSEEE